MTAPQDKHAFASEEQRGAALHLALKHFPEDRSISAPIRTIQYSIYFSPFLTAAPALASAAVITTCPTARTTGRQVQQRCGHRVHAWGTRLA